ncbi:MAG: LacI family DNA-binding transcriptional regulator, partial [Lachnospiraceae bacterium]
MATIKEIAELAGVSRGTVDRVLNNRGSVNSATAEKILEIAKALDYKPNRAGIVLAAQKKRLKLGVILFSADNPFFEDVLAGVEAKSQELSGYNCSVVVKQVHFDIHEQLAAIDELEAEGVNGIAMAPCNHASIKERINSLFEKGIPVVTLNTDIEGSKRIAYVGSNYTHSGETAAGLMHLMTFGKVKLGIVSGSADILCHTERVAGFRKAVQEHYSNIEIVETIENHDDEIESYEKTAALLNAHPDINALFFAAGGVYGGCRAVISAQLAGKTRILAFDKVPTTKALVEDGIIAATICQQPKIQGTKPLDILFAYLTAGEIPQKEHYYVAV